MSIPTFIDLQASEQCAELRLYLKELGASIDENSDLGLIVDLSQIIKFIDVCWEEKEADVESVLNSIVALLIQVPQSDNNCRLLIENFCKKLPKLLETSGNRLGSVVLRVLRNLFEGLGENSPLRYDVYLALLSVAGKNNQINLVFDDFKKVKQMFSPNVIGMERFQNLTRLLHEQLLQNHQSEMAAKVMVELLSTYTEQNASQARNDAQKCIVASLADPNTFLMDHLLTLKPVKVLEGELMHALLTIFVSEKLPAYVSFYESNKSFVDGLGLKHEQNLKKMRLLTFMQIAETNKEITFDTIKQELQLDEASVEPFIIDVLKTRLVRAKIDQFNKKVTVTSTMHRTFGKTQWIQLKDTLAAWNVNLLKVRGTIATALQSN